MLKSTAKYCSVSAFSSITTSSWFPLLPDATQAQAVVQPLWTIRAPRIQANERRSYRCANELGLAFVPWISTTVVKAASDNILLASVMVAIKDDIRQT